MKTPFSIISVTLFRGLMQPERVYGWREQGGAKADWDEEPKINEI